MNLAWPQITMLTLMGLQIVGAAILDGDPKTGTHKFSASLISVALSAWLLWAGGFFATH